MSIKNRYRYPGANYFKYEDQDIFCGRDAEKEELYTQVMIKNTLVLHAESGTGKSSLIQAGLIPLIEKKHVDQFIIITYRLENFNNLSIASKKITEKNAKYLVKQTINKILKNVKIKDLSIPFLEDSLETLWIIAKKLSKINKKLILIFDQFEELQSYPIAHIEEFKKSLSELDAQEVPKTYQKIIKKKSNKILLNNSNDTILFYNEAIKFIEDKIDVKLIFVIREDKLGIMSLLSDLFPNILKHDFILQPLTDEGAKQAIIEPALKEGNFLSHQFIFKSGLPGKILNVLKDNRKKVIESFQLQLVCQHAENIVINEKSLNIITEDRLGNIEGIFQEFYINLIEGLVGMGVDENEKSNLLELLEKSFIYDKESRRMPVLKAKILEKNISLKTIKYLEDSRLIRSVAYQETFTYELSHDTLIEPILNYQKDRLEKLKEIQDKEERERDRIRQEEELKRIQMQEEEKRKKQELKLKEEQKKTRQQRIIIAFILVLTGITLSAAIFGFSKKNEAEKALEELEKKKLESKLDSIENAEIYQAYILADLERKSAEIQRLIDIAKRYEALKYPTRAKKYIDEALEIDSTNDEAIKLHKKYKNLK